MVGSEESYVDALRYVTLREMLRQLSTEHKDTQEHLSDLSGSTNAQGPTCGT